MVSRTSISTTLRPARSLQLAATLNRYLVRVTLGLSLLLFTLLLSRHRAGMMIRPLPANGMVILAFILTVLFSWFHATHWNRLARQPIHVLGLLEWMLPLGLTVLVMMSIGAVAGSSRTALACTWILLGTSEASWAIALIIQRYRTRKPTIVAPGNTGAELSELNPDLPGTPAEIAHSEFVQQLTRTIEDNGSECIQATARADFQPGQRTQTVHLAFCPSLTAPPVIECHQLDGPGCRIKTAESQVYGARFEVRLLDLPGESVEVTFHVGARTDSARP